MARPVRAALVRAGLAPGPVLRAAAIAPEALDDVENRLPSEKIRAFWEQAALSTGDRAFGLHVAEATPAGSLDVIEYIFATSSDLHGGLKRLSRYSRLIEDSMSLEIVIEPDRARVVRNGPLSTAQYDGFALAMLLVRSRAATGVDLQARRVSFQHGPTDHDSELARVFGCPPVFSARHTELVLAGEVLEVPFRSSEAPLLEILERYADSLLRAVPEGPTVVARASSAVAREMAHCLPTLATTAATLHIPARTLQRQLADSGVTHSGLVDKVRRELALRYIGDAAVSMTEIGYLLHFSGPTAFYRAFKRWTGQIPTQYRDRMLGARR